MADMNNILVQDDAGNQITLLPITNADKNLVWRGNAAGVPIDGQTRLTATWDRLKSGDYKLSAKLEVPVMETIGSAAASGYVAAPAVAYVMVGICTMFAPARSTIADRANMYRMLMHALCGAGNGVGGGFDPRAATADLAKNNTGPMPYGFTNLVMPN